MIALCRYKSVQNHLHENTPKRMKFIKSQQEMARLCPHANGEWQDHPFFLDKEIKKGLIWHVFGIRFAV